MLAAHLKAPLQRVVFERRAALGFAQDARVDLFVDAWNTDKKVGLYLAQFVEQPFDALGESDFKAEMNREKMPDGALKCVTQWQKRKHPNAAIDGLTDGGFKSAEVAEDIAVAQHHTLGFACCAAGVDQGGDLFGIDLIAALLYPRQPVFLGVAEQLLPRHDLVSVAVFGAFHADDVLKVGEALLCAKGADLFQLCLAGKQEQTGFAVVEDVRDIFGGAGGINRHADRAKREDRHIRKHPLWAIFAEQADHLLGLYEGFQGGGKQRDLVEITLPSDRLPALGLSYQKRRIMGRFCRSLG